MTELTLFLVSSLLLYNLNPFEATLLNVIPSIDNTGDGIEVMNQILVRIYDGILAAYGLNIQPWILVDKKIYRTLSSHFSYRCESLIFHSVENKVIIKNTGFRTLVPYLYVAETLHLLDSQVLTQPWPVIRWNWLNGVTKFYLEL